MPDLAEIVNQLIAVQQITYQQYQELSKLTLGNTLDAQAQLQIDRLLEAIHSGLISIVE
ncbi:MAG: hypothetical protein F6J97_06235 [Leptolyngbya sp. SIO4C1]|nr:hypothetical protein [Leptolyngbya sp. SIO4C1]